MDDRHWVLRAIDAFTPSGVDGFLLGLVVSLGGAVILWLWITAN